MDVLFKLLSLIVLGMLIIAFVPFRVYFKALMSGVNVTFMELIVMRLRKTPVMYIVDNLIRASQSGVLVSREQLELHYWAGGRVDLLVAGMIAAKQAGLALDFEKAHVAELVGVDLLEEIKKKLASQQTDLNIF